VLTNQPAPSIGRDLAEVRRAENPDSCDRESIRQLADVLGAWPPQAGNSWLIEPAPQLTSHHGSRNAMTHIGSSECPAVLVRAADAELIGSAPQSIRLLADSSSTGGALSAQRVTLLGGADGAKPHYHSSSAELFYLLGGSAQLLLGDQVLVAAEGDLVLVPPGLPHAFAAAAAADADLLIVITPGIERFEYFRHLARIAAGLQPPESLLEDQARYDTFFDASPAWQQARGSQSGS